jgi:carbamoyltransferase
MKVLGIKCSGHDTGAALLRDDSGEIKISAISEARLNRRKHSYAYPLLSIEYVLENSGLTSLDELDLICIDGHGYPWPEKSSQFGRYAAKNAYSKIGDFDARFNYLIEQSIKFPREKVVYVSHIDAHAASAYHVSGLTESAVLTIEGGVGLYKGDGFDLKILCRTGYGDDEYKDGVISCNSKIERPLTRMNISNLYDVVTKKLGLDKFAAGKTMALAAFRDQFPVINYLNVPKDRHQGFFSDYTDIVKRIDATIASFEPNSVMTRDQDILQEYWINIAREAQDALEEDILYYAKYAYEKTGSKNLCLAGGVALSCVTNRKILDLGLFESVFVQPAASDEGIPLGCALWGYYKLLHGHRSCTFNNAYLGALHRSDEIPELLSEWGLSYKKVLPREVAEVISSGKIIGRVFGRSEYGPRALGNRSILADPRIPNMLDVVNTQVKHRERYRPFAPSSLEDKQHLYFDLPVPSPFMLMACRVLPGVEKIIPAVIHVDATSRVQTVRADQNQDYYNLIQEFGRITGVFVLLNTSFNDDGEPIVEDYHDAVLSFLRTGLDYLYIEGYLVSRPDPLTCSIIREGLSEKVRQRVDAKYEYVTSKLCDTSTISRLSYSLSTFKIQDLLLGIKSNIRKASRFEVRELGGGLIFIKLRGLVNRVSRRARFGPINCTMRLAQIFMLFIYLAARGIVKK